MRGAALLQRGTADLFAVAAGPAGTEPGSECSLSTRFQIASVTKQFTAAAVLLLADRGVLSPADPVHRWLDDCPAAWHPITLHHLLSHTAGLVHWPQLPGLDVTHAVHASEKLRTFAAAVDGRRFCYHTGDNPGFRSFNACFPDDDVRLAVLSNEGSTDLGPIVHDLIRQAFSGAATP
jgi:CubicO group peptidase (beta-lactamase class C family)